MPSDIKLVSLNPAPPSLKSSRKKSRCEASMATAEKKFSVVDPRNEWPSNSESHCEEGGQGEGVK